MANNVIQHKRTSTAGRQPNTTNSANSQYINAGEFALNMADQILYTSDGTNLITVGANVVNQSVTGVLTVNAISASGTLGLSGQVLTSNSSAVYWSSVSSGSGSTVSVVRQLYTANGTANTFTVTGGYSAGNLDVYLNGVKLVNGTDTNVSSGSTFTILGANPPNNSIIEVVGLATNPNGFTSTYVGNSTVNTAITGTSIVISNSSVSGSYTATSVTLGNTAFISVGNNSVNTQIYAGNVYINGSTLVVGNTTTNVSINSTSISGNLTLNGITTKTYAGAADASLIFSGRNDKGGGGAGAYYNDFIRATAGNGSNGMWFRTTYTGDLQLINSAYTSTLFSLTQSGVVVVGGGSSSSSNSQSDATTNYIQLNNNGSQIYDDGNFHIHARASGQAMWLNTNGGQIIMGNQAIAGGSAASGIVMGSSATSKAYLSVYGYKTYSIGSYGYTAQGGTGTGSSTTAPFSIYSDNRMNATEFDATSDERAKDIQGTIPLETAINFVKNVNGLYYTWNSNAVEHNDKTLKAGFGAQSIHKAGFDHMIAAVPNDKMKKQVDEDGWEHPAGFQLTVGYNQVIPYHHEVIKNLLERIESLETKIIELESNK